jgi:predicted DNA-binding antitoxin AbrB/MazE fold protein
MGSRVVEAEYEKGMLKPSTPLTLRPGERVHLIVMRQPDPKRWDLSRLAESPAADEAVLAEQGLEGWAANLDAEDRRSVTCNSPVGSPKKIRDLTEEETAELELATDEALGRGGKVSGTFSTRRLDHLFQSMLNRTFRGEL